MSSDIAYIAFATTGNALLQSALGWRHVPLKVYIAVLVAICWPIAMRAGYACNLGESWPVVNSCIRHPGRGVTAACMATCAILVLSASVRKDRLSRTMLRLGVRTQVLWVLFVVPTLGQSLLDATKQSALLNQGRYSRDQTIIRWFRFKVSILTSGFVKTLTRHWFSREAEATRIRTSLSSPRFLNTDAWSKHDYLTVAWALASILTAFVV